MIKVSPVFVGRLGNNMLQIACAIGYAKKYGVDWGVKKGYIERGFNAFQVDRFFPHLPACDEHFRRHQEHPDNRFCELHNTTLDNCWFNYHPIPFYPEGIQLAGFFQSWKYFENAEEEVKAAFKLPVVTGYEDYVSVHIRLGDYLQHSQSFPPVDIKYVTMAYDEIQRLTGRDPKIMVFSDSSEICRPWFNDWREGLVEFSPGKNEFEDMTLMASCGHNIISNSTLAWFAAYLNPNPNKIVVSPSCKRGSWFGMISGVRQDVVDLLPPEWAQIEFR